MRTRHNAYALVTDPEFFETIDRYEVDESWYIAPLRAMLPESWSSQRSGVFYYAQPLDATFPAQGWKIHISGRTHTAISVLERTVPILVDASVAFKISADRFLLSMLNSKLSNRGSSGKFMTVYPPDDASFEDMIERLWIATNDLSGPYILSDKRYRSSGVVFYRYGTMLRQDGLTVNGSRASIFVSPEGELVQDSRDARFFVPPWVADPFPDEVTVDEGEPGTLKQGRYKISSALGFSNSGGIFVAEDRDNDNRKVIIKEARPFVSWTSREDDAIALLNKEYEILVALRPSGVTPAPIDFFYDWEHAYLVEEIIEGISLGSLAPRESILLHPRPEGVDFQAHLMSTCDIVAKLGGAVSAIHGCGVLLGDLSLTNVMWNDELRRLRIIDFEAACRPEIDVPTRLTTAGFAPISQDAGEGLSKEGDLYAVAAIALGTVMPAIQYIQLAPERREHFTREILRDARFPIDIQNAIVRAMDSDASKRGTIVDFSKAFSSGAVCEEYPFAEFPDRLDLQRLKESAARFVLANATPDRLDRLFPADHRVFSTNGLNMSFGAAGILRALYGAGLSFDSILRDWLTASELKSSAMPPGLLVGSSGIAWALAEMGDVDAAEKHLVHALEHPLLHRQPTVGYGASGVGLAALMMYRVTGSIYYRDQALAIAKTVVAKSEVDSTGHFWKLEDDIHFGLLHGSSGVALFLFYVGLLAGDEDLIRVAESALAFDISHGKEIQSGGWSWPFRQNFPGVLVPYWAYGSAGIGAVALRLQQHRHRDEWSEVLEKISVDTDRKYSVSPGKFMGLAGIGDFNVDMYVYTGDERYLKAAQRTLSGILLYRTPRPSGDAYPGDVCTKFSCDYATGSAGIISLMDRIQNPRADSFPFLDPWLDNAHPSRLTHSDCETLGALHIASGS